MRVLQVRGGSVDLVCCARAWHWLNPVTRSAEMRLVLREVVGDGRDKGQCAVAGIDDGNLEQVDEEYVSRLTSGEHAEEP